jgi:hypothetical protein
MTTDPAQRSVLLIGKSQLVLDESVAGLRDLGYKADATNDFTDVTGRFDTKEIDLVVFGGQVPPDRKAELREEIGASNPEVIFVHGLAGIPGLIVNQVQGAFTVSRADPGRAPTHTPDDRSIRLTLAEPADVKVTSGGRPRSCLQTRRAIRLCSLTTSSATAITRSRFPIAYPRRPPSPPCRSTRQSTPSASPPNNDRKSTRYSRLMTASLLSRSPIGRSAPVRRMPGETD